MSRRVQFGPAAEDDLGRLVDFLLEKNPDAAWKASEALEAAAASLGEFSERGVPGERPNTRELIVPFGRGDYVIQYRVYERLILITRIFHGLEDRPPA
ncbi:MAG: type II toxin-antitoxin system RelE/ParE family toxin [Pseudomonadota bacterium]